MGRALARALSEAGCEIEVVPYRRRAQFGVARARVIILAVRDQDLELGVDFLDHRPLAPEAMVLHVAGSRDREVLGSLRGRVAGVAELHPFVSVADGEPIGFSGRSFFADADRAILGRVRALVALLGGHVVTCPKLERRAYHLAASLLANGSVALFACAEGWLRQAGIPSSHVRAMLGGLLASVADNLGRLGAARALTGPIRRADAVTVRAHLDWLDRHEPSSLGLYRELARRELALCPTHSGEGWRELGALLEGGCAKGSRRNR